MFIISLIFQEFDKMRAYTNARDAKALDKRTKRKDLEALDARKDLEAARDALKAEREAKHNQFIENAINHLPKIEAEAKAKRDKLLATEEAERIAAVNAESKAAVKAERKAVKAEAKAKRKAAVEAKAERKAAAEAKAERKAAAEAEAERKAAAEADANQQQQSCKCHLYKMGYYVCRHTLVYALSQQDNQ